MGRISSGKSGRQFQYWRCEMCAYDQAFERDFYDRGETGSGEGCRLLTRSLWDDEDLAEFVCHPTRPQTFQCSLMLPVRDIISECAARDKRVAAHYARPQEITDRKGADPK